MRHRESRTVAGVLQYRCTRCKTWKPVGGFYPLPWQLIPYSRCKVRPECKDCDNAARTRLRRLRAGLYGPLTVAARDPDPGGRP